MECEFTTWQFYQSALSYYVILCPGHLSPLICSVPLATDDWFDFKQAATAAMIATEIIAPSLNVIRLTFFFLL